jgi:hypothetical protein
MMRSFAFLLCAALAAGGAPATPAKAAKPGPWKSLFDGTSLDAWRGYKSETIPEGWKIVDGTLTKTTPVKDIMSKDEFGDFELELEWKIGEEGNSGIRAKKGHIAMQGDHNGVLSFRNIRIRELQ